MKSFKEGIAYFKRLRIVDKRRFTVFCTVCALMAAGMFAAVRAAGGAAEAASSSEAYTLVYVGAGDTLWSIVEENYPADTDKRSAISMIKSVNGMTSSTIHPGDALYLPI